MELSITEFRRNLFSVVQKALDGNEVWVRHKGRRLKIVPEDAPSKLSRITPMDILNPGPDLEDSNFKAQLLDEIQKEWEKDWKKI